MRLGPIQISRYRAPSPAPAPSPATPARARPDRSVIGAGGVTLFSGILSGVEYNTRLQGAEGIAVYKRMFSSDGTARAVERAVTLPLRAARMRVEPASDRARDREIAEAVETALRTMDGRSWENLLWHQLLYLRYGCYLFELCWAYRDGRYVWDDVAPRPPATVYRWYTDERGRLAGVQQRVWVPRASGFRVLASGSFEYPDIPATKLLHLVNEGEAGNFAGESIGRVMYKHWLMAETAEKIMAIGVERREIGTEYAHLAPEAQDEDADAVAKALASLHANERGYIIFPATVQDKGIFGQGTVQRGGGALAFVEYHKREMARSYLAEFLQLGSGSTGSYAQHRDKSSFFTLALKSVADYLADANSRGLIKPFVDVNFGPQAADAYPRMEFSRLETRNVAEYAQAIAALVEKGALTADRVTEEAIRADLDLPDLSEETLRPEEQPEPEPEPASTPVPPSGRRGAGGVPDGTAPAPAGDDDEDEDDVEEEERAGKVVQHALAFEPPRELRESEKAVDYAGLAGRLDEAEQAMARAAAPILRRQAEAVARVARGIVEANAPERLERLEVPYVGELAGALTATLTELYEFGRREARRELSRPAPETLALDPTAVDEVLAYLAARGKALTAIMAARVRTAVTYEALRQIRLGTFDAEALAARLLELATRELTAQARAGVAEALNLGRAATFEDMADAIRYVELSSVLDGNSCTWCKRQDGKRFQVGSKEYEANRPPLADCAGGDLCRCIYVGVLKEEAGGDA